MDAALTELKNNYEEIGHPIAYSGPKSIYAYFNGILPLRVIKKFLSSRNVYTLHTEKRKRQSNYNPIRVHLKRGLIEIDLVDVSYLMSEKNKKTKYLLAAIDSFTRAAFVEPLPKKDTAVVLEAFKKIYSKLIKDGDQVLAICADKGSEFINKTFKDFLKSKGIQLRHPRTSNHCPTVERFNRTFQRLITQFCTSNNTSNYVNSLDEILETYNKRIHRMIKMSPAKAELPSNHFKLRNILEERLSKIKRKPPKFKVGDLVRISTSKSFKRSYEIQSSEEVFRIQAINHKHRIPTYELQTFDGTETLDGFFYAFELTQISKDTKFRLKKVVTTRRNRKKISFEGLPDNFTRWYSTQEVQSHIANNRPPQFQPLKQE